MSKVIVIAGSGSGFGSGFGFDATISSPRTSSGTWSPRDLG
jgi:hypothetical protein